MGCGASHRAAIELVIEILVNYITIRIPGDDNSIINIFEGSRMFNFVNENSYRELMFIFQK